MTRSLYILGRLTKRTLGILHEPLVDALDVEFMEAAEPTQVTKVFGTLLFHKLARHVVERCHADHAKIILRITFRCTAAGLVASQLLYLFFISRLILYVMLKCWKHFDLCFG